MLKIRRIYDSKSEDDGFRILVDRLWSRGMSKEKAKVDLWLKDIAPSNELRKSYAHEEARWDEFKQKYEEELAQKRRLGRFNSTKVAARKCNLALWGEKPKS